jgi:hypothetical protein
MHFYRLVVVGWSVSSVSACTVSLDPLDQVDLASGDTAAADDPLAAPSGGLAQRAYVKASNTGAGDFFSGSVALSADGSTLAVGADGEDSAATGTGGSQADNSADGAGAVYVFARRGPRWVQQAYLKASNTDASDGFGISVALSGDGSTLAVGAYLEGSAARGVGGNQADNSASYAGAVYVFARSGPTWSQEAYLKASNTGPGDLFGHHVALSADGGVLAVGAPYEDSAATGIGGSQADNSTGSAGAVYVFARSSTTWSQEAYVKASNTGAGDSFGYPVALSGDGATLAVSALGEASAATGIGGDQADNSALGAGAVYVLARSGTTWTQEAYVKASNTGANDAFGVSLALSSDGSILAVGARREDGAGIGAGGDQADDAADGAGAVYVLARTGTTWSQEAYLKASNTGAGDSFGIGVALSGDGSVLAVGASGEASTATGIGGDQAADAAPGAGAVYLLARTGATWTQQAYVKASNTGAGDGFGSQVALSADGGALAANATGEDSAAIGVDGNQADNSAEGAGAVYLLDWVH